MLQLLTLYGVEAPKYSSLTKWVSMFQEGRVHLNDDPRSRRPLIVRTNANIEFERAFIEKILMQVSII